MSEYNFDVNLDIPLVEKMKEFYGLSENTTFEHDVDQIIKNELWKKISHNDTYLGKNVKVKYFPCSQKYIDFYDKQKVQGIVFFVFNGNMLLFHKSKKFINIYSLKRLYCSYFGDSLGYSYQIEII